MKIPIKKITCMSFADFRIVLNEIGEYNINI